MNGQLPYAVGATTVATTATPAPSEPDYPSSPSSPAFSAAAAGANNKEQSDSGRSSPSAASSSSAADAFSFISTSGQRSPPNSTSALCFGAGGAGVRLWSSSKALAVARASKIIHGGEDDYAQVAAMPASVAPKRYAVGRHLRRISRRLRKARAADKERRRGGGAVVDDTASERAEAVASAIAHCKETLRRATPRWRQPLPSPLSSLSHDLWLHDRQGEITAGAAARRDDALTPPPAAVFPTALARHAPCMRLPPISGRESAASATGTPPSSQMIIGPLTSREVETRGGFSELEFLETFDGDEELIDRHFITVQI